MSIEVLTVGTLRNISANTFDDVAGGAVAPAILVRRVRFSAHLAGHVIIAHVAVLHAG